MDLRISEHFNSFQNNNNKSHYAVPLLENNEPFNHSYDILHIENKGVCLNCLKI